jgi:transcriptional regulator with XRE-family HTH domain
MIDNLISTIGSSLKDLRSAQNISQRKLAKGICTQAYISLIEKGEISPSAPILYSIANRLGVGIDYFFDYENDTSIQYQKEFINQVRLATKNHKYEEVLTLIRKQSTNPLFKSINMKKFIEYHTGLCEYYLNHDVTKAITTLENILYENSDNIFYQDDAEILLALANIYTEEKEYLKANEYFQLSFDLLKKRPAHMVSHLDIRLHYNYLRLLTNLEAYEEIFHYADQGLQYCIQLETYYLHGELHYYKGITYCKIGNRKEGILNLKKALLVFEISKKEDLIRVVKNTINKYCE